MHFPKNANHMVTPRFLSNVPCILRIFSSFCIFGFPISFCIESKHFVNHYYQAVDCVLVITSISDFLLFIFICSTFPITPQLRRRKVQWTKIEEETLKVDASSFCLNFACFLLMLVFSLKNW